MSPFKFKMHLALQMREQERRQRTADGGRDMEGISLYAPHLCAYIFACEIQPGSKVGLDSLQHTVI